MKLINGISRILVGSLFIFSGLIKANDILGFSYKLEEYWVEFGIGWDWLIALDVPMAALICIFEIVLGVAALIGFRMRLTSTLLMLMIVFFTILTFASAQFGLVKSCGCFGDAIPLTPWQSFYKDVILLVFIGILFYQRNEIKALARAENAVVFFVIPTALMAYVSFLVEWNFPLYFMIMLIFFSFPVILLMKEKFASWTVLASFIGSTIFSIHTLNHLPMKDFRPYAPGKSISEQMTLPEDAKPDVYENTFIYRNKATGEEREFGEKEIPWKDDNWEFVERNTELIEKGDEAAITDFSISTYDGSDYTEDFLNDPDPIFIVISYTVNEAEDDCSKEMGKFTEYCFNNGISIIGLSASAEESVEEYRHKNQLMCDFYATDAITLKTIVRSNPGLMLLNQGTVVKKWHCNDIPDDKEVKALLNDF